MELRLLLGSAWQGNDWLFIQADGQQMNLGSPNHIFKKIICMVFVGFCPLVGNELRIILFFYP
jgi:hypothetical protein